MEFTTRSVAVDGRTIRFKEAGAGPVLAVIDGLGSRRPARAQELLAKERRVLVFAPGDGSASAQIEARHIAAALEALGIAPFDVMAHGVGAAVGLWLALERKTAVRSLVLVAPLVFDAVESSIPQAAGARALLADKDALATRLGDLEQPVLALFGNDDTRARPESGARYRRTLRDCNLMFVYDAKHWPDVERPEAVAFITAEFLTRQDQFLVSREDGRTFP